MLPSLGTEDTVQLMTSDKTESWKSGPRNRREFWTVLSVISIFYLLAVRFANLRPVWFDELFTFHIARASSLRQLWSWEVRFDNHTPTAYLLSRVSMGIFGPTPFGLRFPSMVEFYFGSLAILVYVRRKANLAFAVLAVLLLWAVTPTLFYAVEARSYALIFLSFACLLLCWDTAVRDSSRRLALAGIALSTFGLTVAHMFAPFTLLAFVCAECVRFARRRSPDYPLWIALFAPMMAMAIYIPLLPAARVIISAIPASRHTIGAFYEEAFGAPILILVLLVLLCGPWKLDSNKTATIFWPEEIALFLFLFLNPVWLILILIYRHGTFYNRYCLTTEVAVIVAFTVVLPRRIKFNPRAAYAASLVLALFILKAQFHQRVYLGAPRDASFLQSIYPELPIVVGEGQVFSEMNYYEKPAILSRLYYLQDRQASLQFTHTNFFQDFESPETMKAAGYPYVANVSSYKDFVRQHQQFLLLSAPERYVFAKLRSEGASFTFLGDYQSTMSYLDTTLYLVTLPAR
jgi:hypothetical protein